MKQIKDCPSYKNPRFIFDLSDKRNPIRSVQYLDNECIVEVGRWCRNGLWYSEFYTYLAGEIPESKIAALFCQSKD